MSGRRSDWRSMDDPSCTHVARVAYMAEHFSLSRKGQSRHHDAHRDARSYLPLESHAPGREEGFGRSQGIAVLLGDSLEPRLVSVAPHMTRTRFLEYRDGACRTC